MEKSLVDKKIINEYSVLQEKVKRGERIPLRSDTMFNCMLCNSERKRFLDYFLNSSFNQTGLGELTSIEYVKNKLNQNMYRDKGENVDLILKTKNDEYITVELNNNKNYAMYMLDRNLSYAFNLRNTDITRGTKKVTNNEMKKKKQFKKVVLLNINNFSFEGDNRTVVVYKIRDDEGKPYTNDLIIVEIYIPNILKKWYNKGELTGLEKFLYISNISEDELDENMYKGDEIMEDYINEANKVSLDEEVIGLYNLEELRENQMLASRETGYNEGVEDGIKQEKENSKKLLKQEKLEVAKSLLSMQMDINKISEVTKLSVNEINSLIKD